VSGRAPLRDSGPRDNVRQDRANLRATVHDSAAACHENSGYVTVEGPNAR